MARRRGGAGTRVERLLHRKGGVALDIGCGPWKQKGPGWVAVDRRMGPGVDVVHDLWTFPWPFPDDCAYLVLLSHYLEHVPPWLQLPTMAEVWRVAKHGAQVMVAAPYGLDHTYVQDPTHCTPLTERTFNYYDNRSPLWEVYRPPVLHHTHFTRVPGNGGTLLNSVLQVCKDAKRCVVCESGKAKAS